MKWFKMPVDLQSLDIDPKHFGLVCEIFFFANKKTGETKINARSLMTKYAVTKRTYYGIMSSLCRNNIVTKGRKKGQYFCNFNWDEGNKSGTKREQSGNKSGQERDTLPIEEIREEKNRYNIPFASDVIDYLNQKTGKSFKATASQTKKLIQARSNEGYFLEDFKTVIDNQCNSWMADDKMREYLRPSTLFAASKFEGYLNNNSENQELVELKNLLEQNKKKMQGRNIFEERGVYASGE